MKTRGIIVLSCSLVAVLMMGASSGRSPNLIRLYNTKVYDVTPPFLYFKLDSNNGSVTEEEIQNKDLSGGPGASGVNPGKLGNCYTNGIWDSQSSDITISLSGKDFTIRFWYYVDAMTLPDSILSLGCLGTEGCINLSTTFVGTDFSFIFGCSKNNFPTAFNNIFTRDYGDVYAFGSGWHHCVFWYRNGVEMGYRIDDADQATEPYTQGVNLYGSPFLLHFTRTTTDNQCSIDEIAVWTNVLTSTEITIDYNGGAGRTWPW